MNLKPKRHSSIVTTILPDGHAVLVSKISDWAFTLSPMGALVWEHCDGLNTASDIFHSLRLLPELKEVDLKVEEIENLITEFYDSGFVEDDEANSAT